MPPTIPPELLVAADRSAVVARVSRWLVHDLRTPLQSVTLLAELVEHSDPDLLDTTLVASLAGGAHSLARAVERLEQLLRPLPLDRAGEPIVLLDVARFVESLHGHRRAATRLEVDEAVLRELPAVAGIEGLVAHVLLDLLLNAIDALGGREDGRIVLGGALVDDGGRRTAAVTVTDDGPGLPPELGERIFEPLVTTRRGAALAGLGLPAARLLAERMGGTLTGATLPDGGTRMTLALPVWGAD